MLLSISRAFSRYVFGGSKRCLFVDQDFKGNDDSVVYVKDQFEGLWKKDEEEIKEVKN